MTYHTLHIIVPENRSDLILNKFSPEENYLMLKIGSECIIESRKQIMGLTQEEITNKIREENKDQIKKMELELRMEKETSKRMEEKTQSIYEIQIEKLKNSIDNLQDQIKNYELENKNLIQEEVNKEKEKCNTIIEEKERQNQINRDLFEKALKISQLTITDKGVKGESKFNDVASTFKDYNKFYIEDKHTQSGQGDFHLHFEKFIVLADAKNYTNKVDKTQRDKIKKDLIKNEHITFGWLVSLNTNIDKFDKDPIMFEWINTTQCILYINNLLYYENPEKILRLAYTLSTQLYKLITSCESGDIEINYLKETNSKMIDKVKNMKTSIREINSGINIMKRQIENLQIEITDLLEIESKDTINGSFSYIDDWWMENIEESQDETKVLSSEIWQKFKQENKVSLKELNINSDVFKEYIKTKVPAEYRNIKSKKGAIEIINIKLKENNIFIKN